MMKISIFGLGYVGAVSAACLAQNGHNIIGIDRDIEKVKLINSGRSPVVEKDLEDIIRENVKKNRLNAVVNHKKAIEKTEISLICVGTPSQTNGKIDLKYIERVCIEIGKTLAKKKEHHVVVVRSTILPGTIKNTIIPTLEKHSKKIAGKHFGIVCNPEFLREATAVSDFFNPPKTVIGALNSEDGKKVGKIYRNIKAPIIYTTLNIAEMIKYVDNSFHALKIAFANEIGTLCKTLGIDSHQVMNIFCQDKKLNLSEAYLKPGFAFGGSCLPKDLKAITYLGKHRDINLPLLNVINDSNEVHLRNCLNLIINKKKKKIGFLGFAFKAGTDDLRESPIVKIVEQLLGKGFEIRIYDNYVSLSLIRGTNKIFLEKKIPHIAELVYPKIKDITSFADIIVIGNFNKQFYNTVKKIKKNQYVIDFVRISEKMLNNKFYEGICW